MKRHLSDSEPENCDDYEECSSPDTIQISRKKRRGVIEKRRRDRINNCLMELRRLVPQAFEKQGSAKLEKAEILQMTVEHLRHLHTRDPRGFSDPYAAYGNTRAFLDYRIMGIRECVAEAARYLTSVEGVDMKDPMRIRMLNHLENFLSQRELAVNAAVAANAHNTQLAMPKMAQQAAATAGTPVPIPTVVTVPALPAVTAPGNPYAPLTPPRASPDNLSPPANMTAASEPLPRFSVAFPAGPIISFAPTAAVPVPVFRTGPSSFKPVVPSQTSVKTIAPLPTAITSTTAAAKPLNVIMTANKTTDKTNLSSPSSPQKTTKAPFRPWADTMTTADS